MKLTIFCIVAALFFGYAVSYGLDQTKSTPPTEVSVNHVLDRGAIIRDLLEPAARRGGIGGFGSTNAFCHDFCQGFCKKKENPISCYRACIKKPNCKGKEDKLHSGVMFQ